MISLLKDLAALVVKFPELLPLMRTLVDAIRGAGTREEKLDRMRRATLAAGMRTAFDKALPGSD